MVPSPRKRRWRQLAALLIGALAACAQAQTSGSVALVSDYRLRGVSLSDARPAPQLHLGYDGHAGWHLGAFVSRIALDGAGPVQVLGYAGFARRTHYGASWDVGASASAFGGGRYDYAELHAGFASGRFNARLHFSPDYLGTGSRVLYAELNGSAPLGENLRLTAHLGLARAFAGTLPERRADLRLGLNAAFGEWSAELAWVAAEARGAGYGRYGAPDSRAALLSVAYAF